MNKHRGNDWMKMEEMKKKRNKKYLKTENINEKEEMEKGLKINKKI